MFGIENSVAPAVVLLVHCPDLVSGWALRQQRDEFTVSPPVSIHLLRWWGGMWSTCWEVAATGRVLRWPPSLTKDLHISTVSCCLDSFPHADAFARLLIKSHQAFVKERDSSHSCNPFKRVAVGTGEPLRWCHCNHPPPPLPHTRRWEKELSVATSFFQILPFLFPWRQCCQIFISP